MSRITQISWKRFEKFLLFVGCEFVREKGDYRIYWRKGMARPVVIPRDSAPPVFIIKNNLRILRISPEEYNEILKRI